MGGCFPINKINKTNNEGPIDFNEQNNKEYSTDLEKINLEKTGSSLSMNDDKNSINLSYEINNEIKSFFEGLIDFNEQLQQNNKDYSTDLAPILNELKNKYFYKRFGTDEECRKLFVRAQDVVERYLTMLLGKAEIKNIVGCIHTPSPPTPLCKEVDQNMIFSADSKIHSDYERALTVLERAQYLRLFLESGCVLYAAYTEMGSLEPFRKTDEMEIYNKTVEKYKNNLFNIKLNIEPYPKDKTGAIYFFQLLNSRRMVCSVKAYQVYDIEGIREWAIWLGPSELPVIESRTDEVINFINEFSEQHKFIRI